MTLPNHRPYLGTSRGYESDPAVDTPERNMGMLALHLAELTQASLRLAEMCDQYPSLFPTAQDAGSLAYNRELIRDVADQSVQAINDTLTAIGGIPFFLEKSNYRGPAKAFELSDLTPSDTAHPEWKVWLNDGKGGRVNVAADTVRRGLIEQ